MSAFVRDGSLCRRKKRRAENHDTPPITEQMSSKDEQITRIKKNRKTDNFLKTDLPLHNQDFVRCCAVAFERYVIELADPDVTDDEDEWNASPLDWNPPPDILNSSTRNDSLITDQHYDRTKRFLLRDFQNISEECINQDFKNHMLSLDEDKQKEQLERILIQSYSATNGNLKQSRAMIKQLENKIKVLFVFPVEPPTSEVKKKILTCIEDIKQNPKKKNIFHCIYRTIQKETINKKIKKLFGSKYFESDEKFMKEQFKTNLKEKSKNTENNNKICSLQKSHSLHHSPKNSSELTTTSQSSISSKVLKHPIPLKNRTSNVNKKSNVTQNILKEMNVSINDKLNNNINIQVPVSSKQTEIETSNTTMEITDQTVVNNLNFQNDGYLNVQENDCSTKITQMNKNILDTKNSTELINNVLDDKNSENISSRPNSRGNEQHTIDHIIEYLETNKCNGDVDSRILEMETNVIDINLKDIGISKNKCKDKTTNIENMVNHPIQKSDTTNSKRRIHLKPKNAATIRSKFESIHVKNKNLVNHSVEKSDSTNITNNGIIQVNKSLSTETKVTNTENNPIREPRTTNIKCDNYTVEKLNSKKHKKNNILKVSKSLFIRSECKIRNAIGEPRTKNIILENQTDESIDSVISKNNGPLSTLSEITLTNAEISIDGSKNQSDNYSVETDSTISKNNEPSTLSEITLINAEISPDRTKNQLDNYSVETDSTISKNNEPSTLSEVTLTNADISPDGIRNQLDNYSVETDSTISKNNESSTLSEVTLMNADISPNEESITKQIKLEIFAVEETDLANSALSTNIDNLYLTNTSSSSTNVKPIDFENCSIKMEFINYQDDNYSDKIDSTIGKSNEPSTLSEVTLTNADISPDGIRNQLDNYSVETDLTISKNNESSTLSEVTLTNADISPDGTKNQLDNYSVETDSTIGKNNEPSTLSEITLINAEISPDRTKNQLDNYSVEKDSTIGKNNEPSTLSEVTSTNAKISPNKESIIKQIKLGNFMDEKADLANSALDMNIDNIYLTNTSTSSNVKLIDPKNCSIGEKITKNQSNNITVEIGLIINKNNERSTLSEVTLKNAMISPNKEPVYKKIKLIHHTDKITNLAISKNVFIKDDGLCLNNISCTLSEGTLRNAENSSVNEQNTKNKMNNQTIKISNSTTSINDDGLCLSYALSTLPDATMINAENSPITEPITKNSKCLDQNDDFFTIYNSSFSNSDVVVSNDENMFVGGSKSNRNELNNHCVEITNSIKSEITAEIVKSKPLMSVRSEFSLSNSFNGVYSIDKTTTEPRNHRNVEKNNLLENALRKKNSSVLSKKKNSKNNPNLSRTLKKSTKTQVKSPCTNFTVENNPQQFNIAHDSSTSIHLSSYNNIYNSGTFNLQPNNEKDYVSVTPSIQPPINVNYYYSNPIVSLHSFVNGTQQVAMNTSHLISNTQYSNNNLQDSPVIRSRAQPSRILKNNQNSTNTIAQSSVSRSSIYTHSSTSINTQTSVTSDSRSNRLIENTFCNTAQNNSTSNNYYNSATTNNCITYDHVFHDLPNTSFSHPNNNTSSKFNQFSFPPIAGVPYFGNRNSTEPPLNNASFREASINNYLFQNHLNSHYNQNWNKQMSMSSQQVANATVDSFQPSNHNSQSRCMATNCTNCSNCKTGCYCFICYKK